MRKEGSRGVPLCCDASAPQKETKDRTEDGQDCNNSGDNSTNRTWGQGRSTITASMVGACIVRTVSVRRVITNTGRQGINGVHGLRLDVSAANNEVGAIARYTVNGHEEERGSGLEDVCVGGHLRNMVDDRTILVDSIGVVQLEIALAHVHGVSGPTWTNYHDLRVLGRVVGGTGIRGSSDGDIEGFTAVSEGLRDTCRDRAVRGIIGGVEVFNLVGGRVDGSEVDVYVGIRASDHD